MFGRKLAAVGFGLTLLSGASCSRPLCDVNPDDNRCEALGDGGINSGPTLVQKRLHYKTGGQLDFKGLDASASIALEQNGLETKIATPPLSVVDGALSVAAVPAVGFKPGRAKVIITQNSKTIESIVWLFANAKFQKSKDFSLLAVDGKPNWAGVNNKSLYTMHDYMGTLRHLIVRSYDAVADALIRSSQQPWDVSLPSYSKVALTKQGVLQLRQHTATTDRVFVGCLIESQNCAQNNQITAPANTTYMDTDFTADYNENFYAFIDGTKNLNVWSISSRLPTNTPIPLDVIPDSTPITQLTNGDFDGDAKGDLLIWQWSAASNGKAMLFLGQSDGKLKYDSARSMQIQQAVGAGQLTSLSAGDLDADGLADIAYSADGAVQVVINQVNSFKKITPSPLVSTSVTPDIVTIGDFGGMDLEGLSVNDITLVAKKSPGECVTFINVPN